LVGLLTIERGLGPFESRKGRGNPSYKGLQKKKKGASFVRRGRGCGDWGVGVLREV